MTRLISADEWLRQFDATWQTQPVDLLQTRLPLPAPAPQAGKQRQPKPVPAPGAGGVTLSMNDRSSWDEFFLAWLAP